MEFQTNQTAPVEASKPIPREPTAGVTSNLATVEGPNLTKEPSYEGLMADSINMSVKEVLKQYQLPDTPENKIRVVNALNKIIKEAITGNRIQLDTDVQESAKESVEDLLERKGLENNASNLKKVIQILLGE